MLLESMLAAGREGKRLAHEADDLSPDGIPKITVVVDGGRSQRSYGHRYSALSGVACIVGARTGKLLFIGVRNKYCAACAFNEKRNNPCDHHCFRNWNGPSTRRVTLSWKASVLVSECIG